MTLKLNLTIIIFLVFYTVCIGQKKNSQQNKTTEPNEVIDTVIEMCNPNTIDLSRHQLFIDTSRTYVFYERVENSNPFVSSDIISTANQYLNQLYDDKTINKFDFQYFPRLWIPLNKYQGENILYDRCDGSETSYGINDSLFYIFGVHEMDLRKIKNVEILNPKEIEIELVRFSSDENKTPLKVTIKMTERKDIYTLSSNLNDLTSTILVTPNFYVRNFNVLVNHCPTNKVVEFDNKLDK